MNSTGYILDGVYHADLRLPGSHSQANSSTYKAYDHDRQRENHRYELIQPYANGKPNPEFVQMYPEESVNYGFIKE